MASIRLSEYIEQSKGLEEQSPRIVHSKRGDYLAVLFTNDDYRTETIDDLDVHFALATDQIVGFTIVEFSLLANKLLRRIEDEHFTIRDLLLSIDRVCPKCHKTHAIKSDAKVGPYRELIAKNFAIPRQVLTNAVESATR